MQILRMGEAESNFTAARLEEILLQFEVSEEAKKKPARHPILPG